MRVSIDFEYRDSNEFIMDLVCASYSIDGGKPFTHWLHNNPGEKQLLKDNLLMLRDKEAKFVCFNASAEGHAFISLGIDPTKCKWIDLQAEWKMLTNHNDKLAYGKQLIDGKEKVTSRKNYYGKTRPGKKHDKPDMSLLACTYKMIGKKGDLEYKNKMRDLILTSNDFTEDQAKEIMEYCESDIYELEEILKEMLKWYTKRLPTRRFSKDTLAQEILWRGECSARASLMESTGIPVNYSWCRNLSNNVQPILDECAKEIKDLFPEIDPFEWDKKNKRMKMNVKKIQDYIETTDYAKIWERTDNKAISLKLDAFLEHFSYRHEFPKDNFYAQMIRYLKLKQNFNGLKPVPVGSKRGNFFDSVGSDSRARPYLNIYRAQSGRYQPKATSFPFLWSSWIRAVVQPPVGSVICGIDYASQEFLISALNSRDPKMIEAYKSGDPYLYLGKEAGVIPPDGTKQSHKIERDIFKWVTLGISYGMTKVGLAKQLTDQIGREFSEEKAQELIDLFFKVFRVYKKFTEKVLQEYHSVYDYDGNLIQKKNECLKLPDGWYMFGDNHNDRSIVNVPSQGSGASILRKAVQLCQGAGLKVIQPLHDALYVEGPKENMETWIDTFFNLMREAFIFYYADQKEDASMIRLDADVWGPGLAEETRLTPGGNEITLKEIYIDPRGKDEYKKFSKYFSQKVIQKEN